MTRFRPADSHFFRHLEFLITFSYDIDRSTYFLIFVAGVGLAYVSTLIAFTMITKPDWGANRVFPFNSSDIFLPNF